MLIQFNELVLFVLFAIVRCLGYFFKVIHDFIRYFKMVFTLNVFLYFIILYSYIVNICTQFKYFFVSNIITR